MGTKIQMKKNVVPRFYIDSPKLKPEESQLSPRSKRRKLEMLEGISTKKDVQVAKEREETKLEIPLDVPKKKGICSTKTILIQTPKAEVVSVSTQYAHIPKTFEKAAGCNIKCKYRSKGISTEKISLSKSTNLTLKLECSASSSSSDESEECVFKESPESSDE